MNKYNGSDAYELANEIMNAAQRAYDAVVKKYRAREIGDDEYLAARVTYREAVAAFDVAFAAEQNREVQS